MAKTVQPASQPPSAPQQQGGQASGNQMGDTNKPAPQPGTPVIRDWASI
jgi:hypothetical protein